MNFYKDYFASLMWPFITDNHDNAMGHGCGCVCVFAWMGLLGLVGFLISVYLFFSGAFE